MWRNKILLAEDNPNDVELALAALEKSGLASWVDVVRDGVEAMDYLYSRGEYKSRVHTSPAVILLDLKMPRMGGLDVLRLIRSDPSLKLIPVVILTSSREEGDLIQSYKLGANAYVVKPVHFDAFMNAVHQLGLFWAQQNEPPPQEPMPGNPE